MAVDAKSIWARFVDWWTIRRLGVAALLLAALVAVVGYLNQHGGLFLGDFLGKLLADFYTNISTDLASIALTVLIIDYLNECRADQLLKAQLIREMDSSHNGIALRAVRELRAHQWLEDGSLRGADLAGANLESADLTKADLQRAHLDHVNLRKATLTLAKLQDAFLRKADLQGSLLIGADLRGAYGEILEQLGDEQLAQASTLHGATMPDGSRYDGHLKLPLDLMLARLEGVDTGDTTAMAHWYKTNPNPENIASRLISEWQALHPGEEWSKERISELLEIAPTHKSGA